MSTDIQMYPYCQTTYSGGDGKVVVTESGRRVKVERSIAATGSTPGAQAKALPAGLINSKKYFEVEIMAQTGGSTSFVGLTNTLDVDVLATQDFIAYRGDGAVLKEAASQAGTYASWTVADIIGVAFDPATATVWFAKNNTWQNSWTPVTPTGGHVMTSAATILNAVHCMTPVIALSAVVAGARSFDARVNLKVGQQTYAAPAGYVAWDDGTNQDAIASTNIPILIQYPMVTATWAAANDISDLGDGVLTQLGSYGGQHGGADYIDGTVDIIGVAGSRQVYLHDYESGMLLATQWSNPVNGYFKFNGVNPARKYLVRGKDHLQVYNGVIQDNLSL